MVHLDANKTQGEQKTRWELYKNTTSYFEQILESTTRKIATVRPLTSHLKDHPSKTKQTCGALLEKNGQTNVPVWRDLPQKMISKDEERERER